MRAVFLKELRTYFKNPLGYVFIGMMLIVLGIYYALYAMYYQAADYYHVLNAGSSLIIFVIPVLTMRIMSEESKNKTDQMLLTAPIKTSGIVLGKFFAAVVLFLMVVLISVIQPLTTVFVFDGDMSMQMTLGAYIAFIMLGITFISIGMFISSLTENQLVAAVVTIGVFILLNLLDGIYTILPSSRYFSLAVIVVALGIVLFLIFRSIHELVVTGIIGAVSLIALVVTFFITPESFDGLLGTIMSSLAVFQRYADMFSGVFEFGHIVFFLSVTAFFLFLTYQVVEKKRWN